MNVEDAIRGRRTHKAFGSEPLDRRTLDELLDLARWAPNHNLTNPWRFYVVGPQALARLKLADGDPVKARKFDRAPTLVVVTASSAPSADARTRREDLLAAGCAAQIVLLAATARGLASFWRTPIVLERPEGLAALGIPAGEQPVGMIHLGPARGAPRTPARSPLADVVSYLD